MITIAKDWWTNCTHSSGKLWCHCTQWDLARHQNKHLLAEITILGYKVFHVGKATPTGRGGGSIMYIKNILNPIERSSATCAREIIQVYINPKNAVCLKLVLISKNTRITAADDDGFYTMLEEILLSQHECVIMGDFNLPNIDWTLPKQTPTPGKIWCNYLQIIMSHMCMKPPGRTIYWT